ncbi:MAG: tetratricopeptide repeat protein [Acidobacteria bacterium]|nr:tetratricopeptide repeat protein [Acidobacteriota bacterium]
MRVPVSSPVSALLLAGLFLAVPTTATSQPRTGSRVTPLIRDAQQALQNGDHATALRYFRAAVATDPTSPEATCGLGQTHLTLGQYDEAARNLRSCKDLILGQLRRLHSQQAESFARADQEIREIRETIRAIESGLMSPSDPGYLGRLEDRIRELELLQASERIRVEVPAPVSLALGTAYLKLGALDGAENELLAALRAAPSAGEAHHGLAAVYLAQGRWDECAEHVRRAEEAGVRVDPRLKADLEAHHAPGVTTPSQTATVPRAPTPDLSIEHEGRNCAVNGAFVHIEAKVTPSWGVKDPLLHFRSDEADGWYSTTMLPVEGDLFAGTLPKPRGAKRFDYYIEVSNYDETSARTADFAVAVVERLEECAEASVDSKDAGGVLIIDKPRDIADAEPVPHGFSIRGTTADVGILEISSHKALVAGGAALAGAAAAGIALARNSGEGYDGPKPFEDLPGVEFVGSNPPPGSTLSLSGGTLSVELRVYSLQTLPGARITADLAPGGSGAAAPCFTLEGTHDLESGRTVAVVISGPTVPTFGECDVRVPIEQMRVRVVGSNGLGGFRTGVPPLSHLRVLYNLTE